MKPEEEARVEIDKKLADAGWIVQNVNEYNPTVSLGVAVLSDCIVMYKYLKNSSQNNMNNFYNT